MNVNNYAQVYIHVYIIIHLKLSTVNISRYSTYLPYHMRSSFERHGDFTNFTHRWLRPLVCEDKNVPYVFVKSKTALGRACGVSRRGNPENRGWVKLPIKLPYFGEYTSI